MKGVEIKYNFDHRLFRAWYASTISASVSHEQSDEAKAWWARVLARFNPSAAPPGHPGWVPFGGMMDPIDGCGE
jgi:hypothetical protein